MTITEPGPADTMNAAVAAVLRAEKAAQKMTYPQLVDMTGISIVSLKRYLAGDRDITVKSLSLISQALGIKPGEVWDKALERL